MPVTPGQFVWRDLMTTDPAGAAAFYAAVFGWTVIETDLGPLGTHRLFQEADEVGIGGIIPIPAGKGYPSSWVSYIATPNLDRVIRRAKGGGGVVHVGAAEIPGLGRYALIEDPQGAGFGAIHLAADAPDRRDPAAHGWDELCTTDLPAAVAFYRELFAYETEEMPLGDAGTYTLLRAGGDGPEARKAGAMAKPEWLPTSAWVVYFSTADIDAARARIEPQGGALLGPVTTVPGQGRVCAARDTTGALFYLIEWEQD